MTRILIHKYRRFTKRELIFFILLFAFLWILFGFNRGSADYESYKNEYDIGIQGTFEKGYDIIVSFAKNIGLTTYTMFLPFYSIFALIIFAVSISTYSKSPLYVLICYSIYPFLLDAVQIRNFLSMAIVLFALRFLNRFTFINLILCIAMIFIASTIHTSAIVCLVFLMAYTKKPKFCAKLSVFLSIAVTLSILIFRASFLNFFVAEKYLAFDTKAYVIIGISLISLIIFMVSIKLINRNLHLKQKLLVKLGLHSTEYTIMLACICVTVVVFLPFILLNASFYRFIRMIIIIFYCTVTSVKTKDTFMQIQIFKMIPLGMALICFFIELSPVSKYYASVTKSILQNNAVFSLFK